ncbi:HAMP domain-containing sensor histidine kinase [Okibacterium endophyticum]
MSTLLSRWPLRRTLVAATVALIALVSIIVGTISVVAVQTFMVNRVDEQLADAIARSSVLVASSDNGNPSTPVVPSAPEFLNNPGNPTGTFGAIVRDGAVTFAGYLRGADSEPLRDIKLDDLITVDPGSAPVSVNLGSGLGEYRVMATEVLDGSTLVVGLPLIDTQTTVRELIWVVMLVALAGLGLAAAAAYAIVRLALAPLDRVAKTASEVSAMRLDRGEVALSARVPEGDSDENTEVGRVGASINRMLGHVSHALTARQASENKVRAFVSDASHELRTPLASIRGYAELTRLSGEQMPPDAAHALTRIESETKRMTAIVEDLLLLARLDEGRELAKDPVDLGSLVADAIGDARAVSADHDWVLDVPDHAVTVTGDSARLYQVVANLLANARVHTPVGTRVTASLSIEDGAVAGDDGEAGGARTAVISVHDNGPGIDPSIAETVFERFVRADTSRARTTGSTGLGLAIVSAVVEAHGGAVSATSEPGDTLFCIKLPLAP